MCKGLLIQRKMKKLFILFFFLYLASYINAQVNLVPNPSFEFIDTCFLVTGGVMSPYNQVPPWDSPSNGSPDPYNTCHNGTYLANIPFNFWGYQIPHSGNGYVGQSIYRPFSPPFREYLQVKLDSSLILNRKYCISFYVSLSDSSRYAVSNMGIYLSNSHIYIPIDSVLNFTPQINDTNIISDTANWTLISGQYTALGGEQYILIGNFFSNIATNAILKNGNSDDAYYYIDDLSVVDCTGIGEDEINNPCHINLSPNPTNGIMQLSYSFKNNETGFVILYDVLGEKISTYPLVKNENRLNINETKLEAGVYFYKVYKNETKVFSGKIIISK